MFIEDLYIEVDWKTHNSNWIIFLVLAVVKVT